MELLKVPNVRDWGHPVFMVRSREGHPDRARTLAFVWQKANRHAAAEKTVRKIEAAAMAFLVAQTVGLSTGQGAWSWLLTSPRPLKSVLHPARFKAANCKAVLWSSVDTRA
jgi:hypothetical protein